MTRYPCAISGLWTSTTVIRTLMTVVTSVMTVATVKAVSRRGPKLTPGSQAPLPETPGVTVLSLTTGKASGRIAAILRRYAITAR